MGTGSKLGGWWVGVNLPTGYPCRFLSTKDKDERSDLDTDSEANAYAANLSCRVAVDSGNKHSSHAYITFLSHPAHTHSRITSKISHLPWIFDSSASKHMTPNWLWFIKDSFRTLKPPHKVLFSDDSYVKATGTGTMVLMEIQKGNQLTLSSSIPYTSQNSQSHSFLFINLLIMALYHASKSPPCEVLNIHKFLVL